MGRNKSLDDNGMEIPDQTPAAIPLKFKRAENMLEQVQRFVRQELSAQADAAGFESFDEADDFYVEDDIYPPRTRYELDDDNERYDIRNDPGYQKRDEREEGTSPKRTPKGKSSVQPSGEEPDEDTEGAK